MRSDRINKMFDLGIDVNFSSIWNVNAVNEPSDDNTEPSDDNTEPSDDDKKGVNN